MDLYTIGSTKRSAAQFFDALESHGVRRLVDVRLKGDTQLAGFTRKRDLPFLLHAAAGIDYVHEPLLCPTDELLSDYQKKVITWEEYERGFRVLMQERRVTEAVDRSGFSVPSVLLCSEFSPEQCHRRLVAEQLATAWGDVSVVHI